MRQASESPTRDNGARPGDTEYPFVNQSFVPADSLAAYVSGNAAAAGSNRLPKGAVTRSYGYRIRGGPKRPPNAYMM